MQRLRVALVQTAPKLGDVEQPEQHLRLVDLAKKQGAAVAVFPELSLTGYLLEDQVPEVALATGGPIFGKLLRGSRSIDLVVGFVEEAPGHLFHNAAAYLSGGKLVHVHRKVYLPTYGMFHEGRDFAPGDRVRAFDSPHGRFGILICEDAWHPMCAWLLTQQGAEAIFVLSSGPTRGARPGRGISSVDVWHLAMEPEIILLDEPCSGLDPISTAKIEEALNELKQGYTIVLVSNNTKQIARTTDYAAFFYMGELIEYGKTSAIFTTPAVRQTEDYIQGKCG